MARRRRRWWAPDDELEEELGLLSGNASDQLIATAASATGRAPFDASVEATLAGAEVVGVRPIPWGSNYSFIAVLSSGGAPELLAVYKPRRGEVPLWDFPDGTLYQREYAAYRVSRALGLGCMLGCMIESGLGIAAGAHIASLFDHVDLDGNLLLAEDPWPGVELVDGVQVPADRPGLGVREAVPDPR